MRRMRMCEELGRGWDRMVIMCETKSLPAPKIRIYQESTKVTIFPTVQFTNLSQEDKLWSTYLHACLKFVEGGALTNGSLRERFGVGETSAGSISRLIKDAVEKKLIKPFDPDTALMPENDVNDFSELLLYRYGYLIVFHLFNPPLCFSSAIF